MHGSTPGVARGGAGRRSAYSLVTPSILLADAVGHPRAADVLAAVEDVLLLSPAAAQPLADAAERVDEFERISAWAAVLRETEVDDHVDTVLAEVRAMLAGVVPRGPGGADLPAGTAERLARSMYGGLDAFVAFLDRDALDWADVPPAIADAARRAVADRVAAAWAVDLCPADTAILLAGWEAARASADRWQSEAADILGPGDDAVGALVERISALTPDTIVAITDDGFGLQWSRLMHDAAWAAYTCGRLRAVALAQTRAVQALVAVTGDLPAAERYRAVNAVAAAATATVLADVLSSETCEGLLSRW